MGDMFSKGYETISVFAETEFNALSKLNFLKIFENFQKNSKNFFR